MKYVIVIPDGCADEPHEQLDGQTPLEAAKTPNMDQVAKRGRVGAANHTPSHLTAGSAVANMSLFGYDPNENFTGRAPLEAAAQGIDLSPWDWAIRCNLVTITDQKMASFTAGHISNEEAQKLLKTAGENLTNRQLEFVPGVSYRNLLIYRGSEQRPAPFSTETRATPPHDLTDKTVENDFPRGVGSQLLSEIMQQSVDWFDAHPVNLQRKKEGKLPATNVWLWGIGRQPSLGSFQEIHRIRGAMITAVDLLRGLAALIGWDRIEVPGATGYLDTDYAAKGRYALDALEKYDLVCVHIEAPDEASHEGRLEKKIEALEKIDSEIVGPIHEKLEEMGPHRMLVTPDHPTYIRTKTHTHGDVPFAVCGDGIVADTAEAYHEKNASASQLRFGNGFELMPEFITGLS